MSALGSHTPEALYEHAASSARCFADLSLRTVAHDPLLAVHAAWAADVHTAQAVLWEQVMATPDPAAHFASAAVAVTQAMVDHAYLSAALPDPDLDAGPGEQPDAAHALLGARTYLTDAVNAGLRLPTQPPYADLDHLRGIPVPGAAALAAHRQQFFAVPLAGGTQARVADGEATTGVDEHDEQHGPATPDTGVAGLVTPVVREDPEVPDLVVTYRQHASAAMNAARLAAQEQDHPGAVAQAWAADWASAQAYLLAAADSIADEALVSVSLRWALLTERVNALGALPPAHHEAAARVRAAMSDALGPVEGERLATWFEPLVPHS